MTSSPDDLSDDPDDLLLLAVEEAGHAVIAWLEGGRVEEVTIVPGPDHLGRCKGNFDRPPANIDVKRARISLAGPAAAMIFTDSDQFWNDDQHDVEQAESFLEGSGISWRELLPRVRAGLERDWERVMRLTDRLLDKQRLLGNQATAVILKEV